MNAWPHLKPQITEFIADLHFQGWTDAQLADKLSNRECWVIEAPFRGEVFNYETSRFTLHQLCNTVEMLTGSDTAFLDELRANISGLLKVEYEQEVAMQEGQRGLMWGHKQTIDRESGAA